jgi:3-oxoacyl-[acyl-carrier protein] reductase
MTRSINATHRANKHDGVDRMTSKRAIVTGGCGAIGSATAHRLAAGGCSVAIIDRAEPEPCDGIEQVAGFYRADLSDSTAVRTAMAQATEKLGGLDILVNAAGITSFGSAAALAEAEWDRVMAINLKAVFLCCQAAIAPMRAGGGGRIVNIGSVLGKNGGNARPWLDPAEQLASSNIAYGISKAGVHALTSYLARELARDAITVNAVAPGPIQSRMTSDFPDKLRALIPLGRLGRPDEVAAAVAYLIGDDAAFITGEILDLNGGIWSD